MYFSPGGSPVGVTTVVVVVGFSLQTYFPGMGKLKHWRNGMQKLISSWAHHPLWQSSNTTGKHAEPGARVPIRSSRE